MEEGLRPGYGPYMAGMSALVGEMLVKNDEQVAMDNN
jgi:hypothetical protein